jgi:CheY-like chemotaxis protein
MGSVEAKNRPRVLLVDDERLSADTRALILNRSGFETQAAYSADTAVEMAMALKPDVLISNLVMQQMSGVELAVRIGQRLPGCRVILLSNYTGVPDKLEHANAQGFSIEILGKPVHPQVLLDHLTMASTSINDVASAIFPYQR